MLDGNRVMDISYFSLVPTKEKNNLFPSYRISSSETEILIPTLTIELKR
jgi:hypothetical protein